MFLLNSQGIVDLSLQVYVPLKPNVKVKCIWRNFILVYNIFHSSDDLKPSFFSLVFQEYSLTRWLYSQACSLTK